jgi:hypothetical protein
MWAHLLVAVVLGVSPLQPIGFGLQGQDPVIYDLEGYLDDAPAAKTVYFTVILGHGKRERTFQITKYQRRGDGDPFVMFDNLGMFRPDFVLLGPGKPIEGLMNAKPGSHVTGSFQFRRGMHVLEVDSRSLKVE